MAQTHEATGQHMHANHLSAIRYHAHSRVEAAALNAETVEAVRSIDTFATGYLLLMHTSNRTSTRACLAKNK